MHGAFQWFGSCPSLQSVCKSDLGQVISHFYPSAVPHSTAVLQNLRKHFWAMSVPARTGSHACHCHVAIDIDHMYPLESIQAFFHWKLAFFWIWHTMEKAPKCECISPKTQLGTGSSMLAYRKHFSLCSERIRLNPLALIPAAMVSPSLLLETGKIVICEKIIKNTDLPIHSGGKY